MKVKVNGNELDLEPGTSAIDAVFAAGYDVPYFCSQEYMSPIGACRMCLGKVGAPRKDRETGEWIKDEETGEPKVFFFPNLMATCTTAIMEGMVIDTQSKEVKQAQSGMMEFTLINHPLDCPVCDKGGACELQDRAYEYGSGTTRFDFDKRHQEKHHALSELITLDRERCIHCKRCVRYFEEVPSDEVLDFIDRGGHTYIGNVEDGLPSNFTGNITDMCPVGALLDTTSRFRGRNWEYDHTRSTSMDDSSGSAVMIDARTGRIERIKAARNTQVNLDWIDDGTRFGHEYANAEDRLKTPLVRKNGTLEPATWDEAAEFIKDKLESLGNNIGVVLRADATLEEAVAAKALAEQLGTGHLDHFPRPAASVIPSASPATITDVATSDGIFVIGDVTEEVPILDLRIKDALKGVPPAEMMAHGVPIADLRLKERMPRKREILSVAAPYRADLMKHAGRSLVYKAGQEVKLLSSLLEVANGGEVSGADDLGVEAEQLSKLVEELKEAENAVIVYGAFVLTSPEAAETANKLAEVVGAKVMPLGPMANSYGLEAFEVLPQGKKYQAMINGEVKGLFLSGLNPARDKNVVSALKNLSLLVVHDSFPTETTELADVVLPAKTGYEKEGVVVNLEGRYLPVHPAPVDGGESEDFTGLVKALGEAMGTRMDGRSLRSARRMLRKQNDLDLDELPVEGQIIVSKPKAKAREATNMDENTEGNLLLVPSMVKAERLSRNPHMLATYGEAPLRINPEDAKKEGFVNGEVVTLHVGGFTRRAQVRVSDAMPQGLMTLPALPDQPANLTQLDLSTVQRVRQAEAAD